MVDTRIVLDLETKSSFDEAGGRNAVEKLGVSVVGLYRYDSDSYETYVEKDFGQLQNLLIDSSLIVGFNIVYFDLPVLQPYLSIDVKKLPTCDIMLSLQEKLGFRVGLDAVASATLGTGKTATGLDAIKFYKEGRWEELKSYCLSDVKVTKEIFDFGLKNRHVSFRSKYGSTIKEVKVDWSAYGPKKANEAFETTDSEPAQYKLF
jgi:DEAD/DEAH box helicase domain-containing protein